MSQELESIDDELRGVFSSRPEEARFSPERRRRKDTWVRLARNYLRDSDNEFLKDFATYLEEGYKDSEQAGCTFKEPSWATKQQILLKEILDFDAFRLPGFQNRGFALFGKTDFSKLEFLKAYFSVCGLSEFTGGEPARRYVIADCSEVKGYNGLLKVLVKNQGVAYVIFDNCDILLKHDGILQAFKQLFKGFPGITVTTKNGESVNFKIDSYFIFLSNENTLHFVVEKQTPKRNGMIAYNHFNAFVHYIDVYDFNKSARYYGHDIVQEKDI
jgi:hypothetical protein